MSGFCLITGMASRTYVTQVYSFFVFFGLFAREWLPAVKAFRTLHRSILLLFLVVTVAIVTLVHFSITSIVAEQSRAQQQSMSPAFALITEELLKPLHTAQALGQSRELVALMDRPTLDREEAFNMLERLEQEFDLTFFVASENERIQYMSDGQIVDLVEGEVNWYFKYKAMPQSAVADIGKWEDAHFYIDIKVFNEDNEFLGFFGVGKSLTSFLQIFSSYKQQYGYDFLFVDDKGDIMLSSDPRLMARYSRFTNMSELSWFSSLPEEVQNSQALNNRLITIDQSEYLIAEVDLNQFGWTVFLLSPLDKRQTAISQGFIVSVITLLVVIFALFLMVYHLLYYFRKDLHKDVVLPSRTRLPDRTQVQDDYRKLIRAYHSVSIILVDIDHFSVINDTYGRNIGDQVYHHVMTFLQDSLRSKDVIGRWSSEEFILLLPETGPHEAYEIAESLRADISQLRPVERSLQIKLTASFGVSYTAIERTMSEVTDCAEDALYQARRDGCNQVSMQLIS